jgi:FAD-linked oxidoreductase
VSVSGVSRRGFVRGVAAAAAAGMLPGCGPAGTGAATEAAPPFEPGQPLPWRNWAGNQACQPAGRASPASEDEMLELLGRGQGALRPVGSGHSFSALVPSGGTLVASDLLSGVISTDDARLQAEVWAGTRLHQLGPLLQAHGQAQPNLPDMAYPTLGGALATSTHGTGTRFGSLSTQVVGLVLATPSGERLECSRVRNAEVFDAARCSLGALGVVTRVRLQNQEAFRLVETARFEPLEDVLEDVERRREAHRHFELYAFPHASLAQVVVTDEDDGSAVAEGDEDPEAVYLLRDVYRGVGQLPALGGFLYDRTLRLASGSAETRRIGPSFEVLTHDRIARFREMEYTVPAAAGPACLREVLATIQGREIPVVFPIEYRYVKGDDVWLSMFQGRDGCSISIHQYADEDHRAYFAEIEPIFWRYEGRPHWGKLHSLDAARLRSLYPRWQEFHEVRSTLDPEGRLLNPHLHTVLGA